MAKVSKKKSFSAKGVLTIDDNNQIMIEVEDIDEPLNLAEYLADFLDQEVSISCTQVTDIA